MAFSFGSSTSQPQQGGGLFGTSTQSQQTGGLFGNLGQSMNQQPQQQSGGLFASLGQSTQQQPQQQTGGLFGGSAQQPQQQTGGLFGGPSQQPQQQTGGLFGGLGQSMPQQSQQQTGGLFSGLGQSTQQQPQQQAAFGQTIVQQQPPALRLGQSQQNQLGQSQGPPSLWEEGRGLGVYRSIPEQMKTVKEKWDPNSLASPLRTYVYQVVGKENAPFYQPGPGEDEHKWEEAVSKRPASDCVPALVRGFWDLGKRAQRQREFIEKINIRLHDINQSLDAQLVIHSQNVASRLEECRRKHVVACQRTLVLAGKIQTLRNRGYVMDNAEEDLKMKLLMLEREVFDPSLNGREQEIWARMLGIRDRGRRLQKEIDKTTPAANNQECALDEGTVQAAKRALEAYDVQLRHLQKEMQLVQEEYEDWEKGLKPATIKSSI